MWRLNTMICRVSKEGFFPFPVLLGEAGTATENQTDRRSISFTLLSPEVLRPSSPDRDAVLRVEHADPNTDWDANVTPLSHNQECHQLPGTAGQEIQKDFGGLESQARAAE